MGTQYSKSKSTKHTRAFVETSSHGYMNVVLPCEFIPGAYSLPSDRLEFCSSKKVSLPGGTCNKLWHNGLFYILLYKVLELERLKLAKLFFVIV